MRQKIGEKTMEQEKVILTKSGKAKLEKELRELLDHIRPEVIEELKAARAQGDLSENADYDAARAKQAEVEGRIKQIEDILANAQMIEESSSVRVVKLGSTVVLHDISDDTEETYTIVGSVEANPIKGLISNECALGEAIVGKKPGDRVTVKAIKPYDVEIIKIL